MGPRRSLSVLMPLAVVALVVGLALSMEHTDYDIWGSFIVGPALILLTVPIATRAARADDDPGLFGVAMLAVTLKLTLGVLTRFFVNVVVYGGTADSVGYDNEGRRVAAFFRDGVFDNVGQLSGTRFIEVFTGAIYAITGPSELAGFMVYAWCSFLGCFLFYRAFRLVYPAGDHKRYRLLVLFFPSLLYWPASIGKDAFMVLMLGIASYGVASLLNGRPKGLLWMLLGLWGCTIVRPHLALAVLAGLVVSVPLRGRVHPADAPGRPGVLRGRGAKLLLILGLAVVSVLVISQTERFFKLESLDIQTAGEVLERTEDRTARGGSEFTAGSPASPTGMVQALVTVIYRPFPFEVSNLQGLLAALEGMGLIALTVWSLPRLARLPIEMLRHPYLAYAAGYVMAFCFAFSSINNFGILARQRSQLLPLLFALFCVAPAPSFAEAEEPPRLGLHTA